MKVLVLNPISRLSKNVVRDVLYGCWCKGKRIGGATVPPFGLLMVATVLKKDGNDVIFLDAQAEQLDVEKIKICAKDFNVVIIATSTMSYREDAEVLSELKTANPNLKTVVFGSHPTFLPHSALSNEGVDIIIRREPEYVIRDLIREIKKGDYFWKQVRGIGYRNGQEYIVNDYYPFIENLDELPYLDTSFLPKRVDYFNPIVKRTPYITISTSRGCPGRCTFCTAPLFDGMRIRYQSGDYVLGQIEEFLKNGFKEIYFRDDTFLVDKDRDIEICKGIIDKGYDITWICNVRIGMVNKEMMELIKKAGCHLIKTGVESGVQEILDNVKKGIKIEQTRNVFKWAKEVGINTHAHVMLGMPGETKETLKRTVNFVLELEPTTATFGICTPYPGTPLFEEVAKLSPELKDGTSADFSKLHTVGLFNEYYTDLNKQELEKNVRLAYRRFYWRISYLLEMLTKIDGIKDLKKFAIAGFKIFDFSLQGDE
ncbi:MAG: radical SAM protein [Candidatus Omnitrophica bacterium]|nr:radical SAM protein [Candidatus Omnitrophota bacterium]